MIIFIDDSTVNQILHDLTKIISCMRKCNQDNGNSKLPCYFKEIEIVREYILESIKDEASNETKDS